MAFGQVHGLSLEEGLSRGSALLLEAAGEALESAGLAPGFEADLVLGTTLGGMERGTVFMRDVLDRGLESADPAVLRDFLPSCQPAVLARRLGVRGRTVLLNDACSSGTDALGVAFERIRSGRADRILAGGYDPLCEFVVSGFASLMNVSRTRCRPFDRGRDGLALGEGASLFVLEGADVAARRGANPIGFLRGFGSASDAHHMTQPNPDGTAIASAMAEALRSAGIGPEAVGYVNLHGTGTKTNDLSEYRGVRTVFGKRLPDLPCSSTKSLMGHALGAAGAVEASLCLMAMAEGFLPPNAGLETLDPEMEGLNIVREPTDAEFSLAMSSSLGFGGGASCVILERAKGAGIPS
jgi:3-oxoacyl-[acyl-carrier-protein] synthase II